MDLLLDSWCRYQHTCSDNPKTWSTDRIRTASLYIVSLRINADRHSIRSTSRRGHTDLLPSQHSVSYRCVYWRSDPMATENRLPFRGLHHLGQLSLTLYLIHFIPIYLGSDVVLAWSLAVPVVIVFTLVWWPLSVFWRTRLPTYSFEYALRQMSRHEEERAP